MSENLSELPDEPVYAMPIKIYFYDTDAGGVVHNVAYLRMVETARSELAEKMGWTLHEMQMPDGNGCPVVARTEIDYIRPARLGDDLKIEARIAAMEKVRFYIDFEITRPADQTLISKCRQKMVTVNLRSMRPVPLRQDWLEKWPHLVVKKG
ncbi:MAG: thioesterase family protein [Verrucomicrobiota bacterium]